MSDDKTIIKPTEIEIPHKHTTKANLLGSRIARLAAIVKHFNARVCPISNTRGDVYLEYFEVLCTKGMNTELISELHKSGYAIEKVRLSQLSDKLMLLVVKVNIGSSLDARGINRFVDSLFGWDIQDEDIDL